MILCFIPDINLCQQPELMEGEWLWKPADDSNIVALWGWRYQSRDREGAHIQNKMADGIDDLLLWGDDFEVLLDILEGDEGVQQQFVANANNVSSNYANLRLEFLAPPQNVRLFMYLWTDWHTQKKFTLNVHDLPATTCQCFCTS